MSDLQPASAGTGTFLQRDYWAVVDASEHAPSAIISLIRDRFEDFPPHDLVVFERSRSQSGPLAVGDELEVSIRMMEPVAVRVTHMDDCSLTLGTLDGHPEAGRITFGAYRNDHDDVIVHIRSQARAGSPVDYAGFLTTGDPMQTRTWTDFIDRLAHTVGDGVIGSIHVEEQNIEREADADVMHAPTFIARGE